MILRGINIIPRGMLCHVMLCYIMLSYGILCYVTTIKSLFLSICLFGLDPPGEALDRVLLLGLPRGRSEGLLIMIVTIILITIATVLYNVL